MPKHRDQYDRLTFLESQPLSSQRYQDDPDFAHKINSLSHQIYPLVASISKLTADLAPLGTKDETDDQRLHARTQLRQAREAAQRIGREVVDVLKRKDVSPAQLLQQKNLRTSFSTTLTELQTTHRILLEKTRQYIDTLRHAQKQHATSDELAQEISQNIPSHADPDAGPGPVPNAPIVAQQLALAETTTLGPDASIPDELELERERDVQETEQGMREIRQLMSELGLRMVEEETVGEWAEEEVEDALEEVEEVVEEVKERSRVRQWGGRVLVVLGIGAFIGSCVWMAVLGDRSRGDDW